MMVLESSEVHVEKTKGIMRERMKGIDIILAND